MDAADQMLIAEETEADPAFGARIQATLDLPGGEVVVVQSAKKAVANELNPALYPETAGTWTRLRKAVQDTIESVSGHVPSLVSRKVASRMLGNLGQDIGGIVGAIAGVIGSVASSMITAQAQNQMISNTLKTNESIAEANARIAMAQAAETNAQAAMTGAPGVNVAAVQAAAAPVVDTLTSSVGSTGIPLWIIILGGLLAAKAL